MKSLCTTRLGSRVPTTFTAPVSCQVTARLSSPVAYNQIRLMNENQRKKSMEYYQRSFPTSYYFDEEKASTEQQFTSLDCVMDSSIEKPGWNSWNAIKKHISMFFRAKRFKERRPDLTKQAICQRYLEYKTLTCSLDEKDLNLLSQYTTDGEAKRIRAMQNARKLEKQRQSSWRSLSMKISPEQAPTHTKGDEKQAAEDTDKANTFSIHKPHYSLHIEKFEIVGGFYGSINQDDWLQLNYRAVGKETIRGGDLGDSETVVENELLEYPVIEIHLTDGVRKRNTYQPIVVAVMDKNGSRYGRDGSDAVTMRKQITRGNSWFS